MLLPALPGVFLIDLPWVNAWLLAKGPDAVLIDTGTVRDRSRLLSALTEALPDSFCLHAVLLTHGHCDHAGNAAYLAEQFGARLCAHAEEVPYLATRRTYVPRGLRALSPGGLLFALGERVYPVKRRAVDVVLAEGHSVETPIGPLRVIHTPGHTLGHVSYLHEAEGWLFSGDALINVIPWSRRTGLSSPMPMFTTDLEEARRSVRRIAEIGPMALLAGHGWPLVEDTAATIRAFAQRLPE